MTRTIPIVCLMALLLTACSSKKRTSFKPLPLNQMKLVTWDMMKAGEWHLLAIAKDSTLRNKNEDVRLYAEVFRIYGITSGQYFDSYKYYAAHPAEFKVLADSIDAYSARERNQVYQKAASPR